MPNIIYVNGFRNGPTEERLRELKENVFHDDSEIVILTEQNCDLSENPYILKAYQAGKFDFVAGYFALFEHLQKGRGISGCSDPDIELFWCTQISTRIFCVN